MTKRAKTSSFTITLKLNTNAEDELYLNQTFGIACHMYNVVVKHAIKCINRLERNQRYQEIMSSYKNNKKFSKQEKEELSNIRMSVGLSEYQFHDYIVKQKNMFSEHIDINTAQKIATRVWQSADSYLFKNGEELHFKKKIDFCSVEGKNNSSGIRFRNNTIHWKDLSITARIKKKDAYAKKALKENKIKYCRIIRRWRRHKWVYYVQLVMEGLSPKKHNFVNDDKNVGIDLGPSTIAVVGNDNILFDELAADVNRIDKELRILNRKIDRQQRANNPDNYNEDGTIKKDTKSFKKKWKKSRRQLLTEHKRKALYQKRADKLTQSHNALANVILSFGTNIKVEDNPIEGWKRKAKKTEISEKSGKYKKKKRFGKSIQNHAPSKLISILNIKLSYLGKEVIKIPPAELRASQLDHITGECIKAGLDERIKNLADGTEVHRDPYSAFIIKNATGNKENPYDFVSMEETFEQFMSMHDRCIDKLKKQKEAGHKFPASMGI